jgi:hypothetical protein
VSILVFLQQVQRFFIGKRGMIDVFDSMEEATDFMRGPINATNPVGVEYDPEDWLAQVKAGKSFSDFLTRRVHEPVSPIRGVLGE